MDPQIKRNLITRLRNQVKIEALEYLELEKQCFVLLQTKHKLQELLSNRAREVDRLEREWFYESGRVKKGPTPKERSTEDSSIAQEFGLTPAEATAILRKAVAESDKEGK